MKKQYIISLLIMLVSFSVVHSQDYKGIIKNYFNENYQSLNLLEEDVDEWIITDKVYSKKSNVTHVYVQQAHNGIPIFGSVGNFAIKENKIFYSKNNFIANISKNINASNPNSTPSYAIEKMAAELNLGKTDKISVLEYKEENKYIYSKSGISQNEIPVSLVYQPMENGDIKLAWNLTLLQLDGKHWWNVRSDATTGEILDKNDYNVSCNFPVDKKALPAKSILNKEAAVVKSGAQFNVYALPVESPNYGPRSIVIDPFNVIASPYGWNDIDGVDGAEYTITRGNNVYAQEDEDGNDGTLGYAPDGTETLNFNFPLDFNQQPAGYQDASIANLFYMNNMMHDIWFQYGFDQAAGSFQTNNYGGGGVGDDPVIADAHDGSGFNNATFGTPPDGQSPGMNMFLWSPPPADLLTVNAPGNITGSYLGVDSSFGGPALSTTPITSDLVLAEDDTELTEDACTTLINGDEIAGKIAVILRGDCNFTEKIQFAQDAGAIAVIMVNNVESAPIPMGGESLTITIPSIMIDQSIGDSIIAALKNNETINVTLKAPEDNFLIDGCLDNGVIAHEYGHGISNRLVGGPANASCLGSAEQMGEGWSDFFGLMVTMKPSDTENDARGIGTYDNGELADGNGIRQYKYSPDMSVNPFTFDDVALQNGSVHGIGSIWATMLWDLNWAMIETYGFDPDVFNGTGGNNMTMAMIIEALKITPCDTGFVDGRDAILTADLALYGGANSCLIWKVFARRGLGGGADSGDTNLLNDQVSSFELPQIRGCTLEVDKNDLDLFKVYPNPSNGFININGAGINEDVMISIFDINGRKVYEKETIMNGNTSINAKELTTGFYVLKIQGEEFTHNEKIIIE